MLFYIHVYLDGNVDLETSLYAKKEIEIYTVHVLYVPCYTKKIIMSKRLRTISCLCTEARGYTLKASSQKYDELETQITIS